MGRNLSHKSVFRWIKALVHFGSLSPLAYMTWLYFTTRLGFNPVEAVIQRTGRAALTLLLLSLTCTPFSRLFKLPRVKLLRTPLGLYAALYATLHFSAFALWDFGLDLGLVWLEISNSPFILVGMVALLILLILAATSLRYAKRKLGKKWVRLHRLVYLAAALVIIHYFMAVKGNIWQLQGDYFLPLVSGGILVFLLLLRWPRLIKKIRQIFIKKNRVSTKGLPSNQSEN